MAAFDIRFQRLLATQIGEMDRDMLGKMRSGAVKTERDLAIFVGYFRALDEVQSRMKEIEKQIMEGN